MDFMIASRIDKVLGIACREMEMRQQEPQPLKPDDYKHVTEQSRI